MIIAHSISEKLHPNCVSIEKLLAIDEPISFDGVYKSVYNHRLKLIGKDITLFIVGDLVGKNNLFDDGRHFDEDYCTWSELEEMFSIGFKVGWHGKTHRNLVELSDDDIELEVRPSIPTNIFAYPYGQYNNRVIDIVKKYFKKAYAVDNGDSNDYSLYRKFI